MPVRVIGVIRGYPPTLASIQSIYFSYASSIVTPALSGNE
jgi:hypothetical protein